MKLRLLVVFFTWAVLPLGAQDFPPMVKEAMELELQGHLNEALDRYRLALSSVPAFLEDEGLANPLTIRVLSKVIHLSVDLGYGEEAWDLSGRLLSAKNQRAAEAGTLARLRLLRLQDRWADALALFDQYAATWPLPPPRVALLIEVQQIRLGAQKTSSSLEALIRKSGGPGAWSVSGGLSLLPGPTEVWGLKVQETVRLQIGAFRDWNHALTLIDMLREKGWAPFTDVKLSAQGEKLHVVYVVSRQPAADRGRLEDQGLIAPSGTP